MVLQPKRILFLTGWGWAEPFLSHCRADIVKVREDPGVEARGSLPSDLGHANFVVAVHPAHKARKPITTSILKSFNALEGVKATRSIDAALMDCNSSRHSTAGESAVTI